ncbi:MAG: 3-isopropylmalate dehydratase small subunit [Desulfobulbaceae bacterium]|nr:3-isopropylmalate dehydratase small subunit [Desulfobulbaceae bacterium]HIJ77803.1 3-isopropylmalate dehydratase small subunit [Deltaproteobacteria bacterium]
MKDFGGKALFLDRSDINTDEIIPAKYLTENTKMALQPFILEDLKLGGFNPRTDIQGKGAIITRANFGCGSSREHAVWVFEVNDINIVIAESFARIFRQNMYNCGMLAVELLPSEIDAITALGNEVEIAVDLATCTISAKNGAKELSFTFSINEFDKELVENGGWLTYADNKY